MSRKHDPDMEKRVSAYLKRIRDLREDHDLSQEKLAENIYVAPRTYSDYERGRTRIPLEVLISLAIFYDIDLNYICGVTNKKKPFPKDIMIES